MIRTLCEELLTKLKKKAAEVCEIQNIPPDYIIQEGDTSQSYEMDQIGRNKKNLLRNTDNDQIQ